ncbi:MAG: alpha/beta hydrolase [Lachnospiraceae bacterium]|nr:alpha/beta hydrolase [Lachnospiraceae bacterium]
MKTALIIIAIIIAIVLILLVAASVILARTVAWPNRISIPDEIKYEKEKGMWKNYDELPKEEYRIKTYDGYELNTVFVPGEDSKKFVIISHGYSGCRLGSVKYLHMFHDLGFNAVMYDDRGHGDNVRVACTMGYNESRDLMCVIKHVYERFGDDIILGLHGESMGSGLTTNALQYSPRVRFIVSDCGYCDLPMLLKYLIRNSMHLPAFLVATSGWASRIMYGYSYKQVRPIEYIKKNEIPICFFHGEDDDFIPCEHAKLMHEANRGYSELHLVPGAGHSMSIITDEAAYRENVRHFLEKAGII